MTAASAGLAFLGGAPPAFKSCGAGFGWRDTGFWVAQRFQRCELGNLGDRL